MLYVDVVVGSKVKFNHCGKDVAGEVTAVYRFPDFDTYMIGVKAEVPTTGSDPRIDDVFATTVCRFTLSPGKYIVVEDARK